MIKQESISFVDYVINAVGNNEIRVADWQNIQENTPEEHMSGGGDL